MFTNHGEGTNRRVRPIWSLSRAIYLDPSRSDTENRYLHLLNLAPIWRLVAVIDVYLRSKAPTRISVTLYMGIVNLDVMTLNSGIQLSNCYITVTPGLPTFPMNASPIIFEWIYDANGNRSYTRLVTVYVYVSKAAWEGGYLPIQSTRVRFPAQDAIEVLHSVYTDIKNKLFLNASSDDGADETNIV